MHYTKGRRSSVYIVCVENSAGYYVVQYRGTGVCVVSGGVSLSLCGVAHTTRLACVGLGPVELCRRVSGHPFVRRPPPRRSWVQNSVQCVYIRVIVKSSRPSASRTVSSAGRPLLLFWLPSPTFHTS
jgi:hypothetical protein